MSRKLQLKTDPVPPRAIVLDTETTGFTPKQGHRIVEVAAIEMIDGLPSGQEFHAYINPQCRVPKEASNIHGLTDSFLRDKPVFAAIAADLAEFFGSVETPYLAHNASFDQRFVDHEMSLAGCATDHAFSCSLKLARALPHGAPGGNKLASLAALIGHNWGPLGAHSALEDTHALGAVLHNLLWPLEAKTALTGTPGTKPAARPEPPRSPSADMSHHHLPAGFMPLTAESDARIRRYDTLSIDGRIFARGKRWTPSEEAELTHKFVTQNADIDTLVTQHGRTPAALILKLEGLGIVLLAIPIQGDLMSFVINNGFMLAQTDLDTAVAYLSGFRDRLQQEGQSADICLHSRMATTIIDREATLCLRKGEKSQEIHSPLSSVRHDIIQRRREIHIGGLRDTVVDFDFSVVLFPLKGRLLGAVYSERTDWIAMLLDDAAVTPTALLGQYRSPPTP